MEATMNRILGWAIAALLLAAPDALAQNAGRQFNVGTLNGTTYTNSYFGMTFKFPAAWKPLADQKKKELADTGAKQLGKNIDAETQRAAEEALRTTTFNLLTIIKYGPTQQPEANIVVAAERLPQTMESSAYLTILHDLTKKDRSVVDLSDVTSETISKRSYATFLQKVNNNGTMVQQKYIAYVDGGYALAFIMTFTNDSQRTEMTRILESIQFRPGT
jgi:hypothetical protein